MTNKARYAYDSLYVQRLESAFLKVRFSFFSSKKLTFSYVSEVFLKLPFEVASLILFNRFLDKRVGEFSVYFGDTLDLESAFSVKNFFNLLGNSNFLYTFESFNSLALDFNFLYLFNVSLLEFVKLPSFCLLIGTNLRFESPLINFRLARCYYETGLDIYKIGSSFGFSSYKIKHISPNLSDFFKIVEFKHTFCKNLYYPIFSYHPYLLFGQSISSRADFLTFIRGAELFFNNIKMFSPSTFVKMLSSNLVASANFGLLSSYSSRLHYADLGLTLSAVKFLTAKATNLTDLNTCSSIWYSIGFDFNNINYYNFGKEHLSSC